MTSRTRVRVIVNPSAGGGRAGRALPALRAAVPPGVVVDWIESRSLAHLEELVAAAAECGDEWQAIAVAGGDGTVKHALEALPRDNRIPLAVIPIGSGNDFARDLGIPRDPVAALHLVFAGVERTIDVARVDGGPRYGCVASVGLDEIALPVVHHSGLPRGWLLNILAALWAIARYRPRRLHISWEGGSFQDEVMFASVSNTRCYAGGFMISPGARLDDGKLDLCIIRRAGFLQMVLRLGRVRQGTHAGLPGVLLAQSSWVRVEQVDGGGAPVALDGELPERMTPLRLICDPSTVRVIAAAVPK